MHTCECIGVKHLHAHTYTHTRSEPAVDMVQLLAMDYQKVWLEKKELKAREKKRQASSEYSTRADSHF